MAPLLAGASIITPQFALAASLALPAVPVSGFQRISIGYARYLNERDTPRLCTLEAAQNRMEPLIPPASLLDLLMRQQTHGEAGVRWVLGPCSFSAQAPLGIASRRADVHQACELVFHPSQERVC